MKKIFNIAILISFILLVQQLNAGFVIKPYLQITGKDSLCMIFQTESPDTVFIEYSTSGNDPSHAKTSFYKTVDFHRTTFYLHRVFLPNLIPAKEYTYLATQKKDFVSGKFHTPPDSGFFRFAALADTQLNPDIHSLLAYKIKKVRPDLVVYAGDISEQEDYAGWKSDFFTDSVQDLISEIPFVDALGNHEGKQLYKIFFQPPKSGNKETYYSFDAGGVHFLILNTQMSLKPKSPQYQFALKDLSASKAKWKVVVMHKPVVKSFMVDNYSQLVTLSDSVFVPNRVDLVISGHIHFYQRNLFKGIVNMIIGGGGAPFHKPTKENTTILTAAVFHYAVFEFDPVTYMAYIKVYNTKGEIIDAFELQQHY